MLFKEGGGAQNGLDLAESVLHNKAFSSILAHGQELSLHIFVEYRTETTTNLTISFLFKISNELFARKNLLYSVQPSVL